MKLRILGGGGEVGRAALELVYNDRSLLLDYGINFSEEDIPVLPLHIPPKRIDAIVASHVHLDHIGAIPMLYITGKIPLITTQPTRIISRVMWEDFLKISGQYLPFEFPEVLNAISNTMEIGYNDVVEIGRFSLELVNAGHIPGSAMVKVYIGNKTILYTGDVNTIETKLVPPADLSRLNDVDIIITEATYGSVDHPPRPFIEDLFIESVREVVEEGGTALVPAFSVGRSQEILMLLAQKMPFTNVFYDGMIRTIIDLLLGSINKKYINKPYLLEKASKEFYRIRGWQDRRKALRQPGVIVASAGMLKGGPSLYYLKKLGRSPRNAIFLVSFQAPTTPGRHLLEFGKPFEGEEKIRARVKWFDFSSHAGRSGLLQIVKSAKSIEKVIIVHSDFETATKYASRIKEELGVDVLTPSNGEEIEI